MDIYLEGKKDGIELAAETRKKYRLPVIFLTAFSDVKILERAKVAEPFGYIMKPFQSRELHSSIEMALHKHHSETRIDHLNSILRAIREVSQLIVKADNITELIQKACDTLISTRGYVSAWICLIDEDGTFQQFVSSGLSTGASRFYTSLEQGFMPDCVRCLQAGIDTYLLRQTTENCGDCPLREVFPENDILTTRIRYKDKHLGYLSVTALATQLDDKEEINLFTEISEDLGLALSNLDRLKKKEKADQDLVRARNDWERTFDAIPDLIAIIDADHRILRANKAMTMKLGCSIENSSDCVCYKLVHGLDSAPDFCPHTRTLRSGKEESAELVESRLGGIFDITTTPLNDEDGNLIGTVHVARDITSRKKKEQLLLENLALGEFALNHPMNDLLSLTIEKAEMLTGSKIGFFHCIDEDEKTIIQQTWSNATLKGLCTAESCELPYPVELAGVWADCMRERRPLIQNDYVNLPCRKGLPDGHTEVIRELTVPIIRGEKVVAILGVGNKPVDYTTEDIEIVSQLANLAWEYIVSKRFEVALHKSEHYARALLDAVPDLMFRMSRDGVYLDYKASNEDLHYQSGSIVGKKNRDMTPSDFADLVDAKIRLTLESGSMVIFEYQLPVPGKGLRHFEARMLPSGPDEITTISRDITERKRTEEALQKKIEELEWFNHLMIDREVKMIELKKEINQLANRLGEEDRYVIHYKQDIS
jgi:PAS domain S-box-containing protein